MSIHEAAERLRIGKYDHDPKGHAVYLRDVDVAVMQFMKFTDPSPITPEALASRGWAFRESDQVWYAPESGGFWGYAKQLKILHGGRYWHFKIQQEVDNVTTYDIGANITTLSQLDHLLAALTPEDA